MLDRFLNIEPAIKSALSIAIEKPNFSNIQKKLFKLLNFNNLELKYIKDTRDIFKIFIKASNILQAEKYPTIQYIYPYIYLIRIKLEAKIRNEDLVSY